MTDASKWPAEAGTSCPNPTAEPVCSGANRLDLHQLAHVGNAPRNLLLHVFGVGGALLVELVGPRGNTRAHHHLFAAYLGRHVTTRCEERDGGGGALELNDGLEEEEEEEERSLIKDLKRYAQLAVA